MPAAPPVQPRAVAVVTGTRAEFGLLRPIMRAIDEHPSLVLRVLAGGAHLLPPARTIDEVRAEFDVAAEVPMQTPGETGRGADARALARGVAGFADALATQPPEVVIVLGDRIEAFAAASAASVMGLPVAHVHGGDRAEGIADEAMRHAITKLAHLHFPATEASAERLRLLGEDPNRVVVVGSPAVDELLTQPPLDDETYTALGSPRILLLFHPVGDPPEVEAARARTLIAAAAEVAPPLLLDPNFDPGREGIAGAIEASGLPRRSHLPRATFLRLLRRGVVLLGNSSAGLIEAAAAGARAVDVGRRQAGRERAGNAIDLESPEPDRAAVVDALRRALAAGPFAGPHPFGDGRTGPRVAERLARVGLGPGFIRKRNTY